LDEAFGFELTEQAAEAEMIEFESVLTGMIGLDRPVNNSDRTQATVILRH